MERSTTERVFGGAGGWAWTGALVAILSFVLLDLDHVLETGPHEPQPIGSEDDIEFFANVIEFGTLGAISGASGKVGVNSFLVAIGRR